MKRRSNGWIFSRKGKHGRITWYAAYIADGHRVREAAGKTKTAAAALLQQRITELNDGRWAPPGKPLTYADIIALVKDDYRAQGLKSWRRVEGALKHLDKVFGRAEVADITAPRLARYVADRLDAGAAISTVRNETNILKRAMNLAIRSQMLSHRPAFPVLRPNVVRTGFFERAELDAICAALPEPVRAVALFLFLTGWRCSEALSRQWKDVDFAAGMIRLEAGQTKNGQGRTFPFGVLPELKAVLDAQRAYSDAVSRRTGAIVPWVFHREGKPILSFRTCWKTACKKAELIGKIPHDFRRTAVRNLVRAGVPEKAAMLLSGHLTRSVFDRYCIVNEADLRESVGKLAAAVPDGSIIPLVAPNWPRAAAQG